MSELTTPAPQDAATPATTTKRWPGLSDLSDLFDLVRSRDDRRWRLLEDRFGERFGIEPMRIEEETVDGVLHVRAEGPGIDPATDADISVHDGQLRIKVERKRESRTEGDGAFRTEFRYGSLYRTVPIGLAVDPDAITATYRDGVLDVAVPMPAKADTARKVEISRS